MQWIHIIILAAVQGLAELLPISSSAHVIVVAELFHVDMSSPANALLLVMLHTGTMFAVIAYFRRQWLDTFFSSWTAFWSFARMVIAATFLSAAVGYPLIRLIVHILSHGNHHAEIEDLFNKLNWIAPALAAGGLLILYAGLREARNPAPKGVEGKNRGVRWCDALVMGIVQGFAIPFRGFSRSGSTISAGLLTGGGRTQIESFSFAMAVVITPVAIAHELMRLLHFQHSAATHVSLAAALAPSLLGMVCAFLAGLLALKWLSRWLEQGRWYLFGVYCLVAAVVVQALFLHGW